MLVPRRVINFFLPKNLPLPEATSEPVGVLLLTSRAAASLRRWLVLNRRHPSTKETEALKISETGNFASKMVVVLVSRCLYGA